MSYFVFLDVDKTLLLVNDDRDHVINQTLLDHLKVYGYLNVYLFTNMDLADHEQLINDYDMSSSGDKTPVRISRYQLIDELKKQGFVVHGVITPADPGLNKGIGVAYDEFYLPDYEGIQRKINKGQLTVSEEIIKHRERNEVFRSLISIPQLPAEYAAKRLAGQKYNMFSYFIEGCSPNDIKHILYVDDDEACLEAAKRIIEVHRGDGLIKLSTVRVLGNGDVDDLKTIENFYSPALAIDLLVRAEAIYGKSKRSVAKFIANLGKAQMADLKSVNGIISEYIDSQLERNKKPSKFLAVLLSLISEKPMGAKNFYVSWEEFRNPPRAAIASHPDAPLVSPRNIFSFTRTMLSSSSSSSSSSPSTPKLQRKLG
ncbi:MAG: hypothetical protein ACYC0J_07625 [Gammaproteobacteria bacterium]